MQKSMIDLTEKSQKKYSNLRLTIFAKKAAL